MLNLSDSPNSSGRRQLSINHVADDTKNIWNINIESVTFPTPFENSSNERRRANATVIDGNGYKPEEHPSSMLIPLTLVAITNINDVTMYHYQQKYTAQSNDAFQAKISTIIAKTDEQSGPVENPCLLLEMSVIPQEEMNKLKGNTEQFTSSHRGDQFVRRDWNENANGGLDIPINQVDHFAPGDRVETVV